MATTRQGVEVQTVPRRQPLPPLEHGDALTRDEFERRYHAMPGVKKAELIEGRVYLPSPVRRKIHSEPDNSSATQKVPLALLPLENGDALTRDEFERRYHAMPEVKKAELIEGRVYMPSPVRCRSHGTPDRHLNTWLGVYSAFTPGTFGANNATVRLDQPNEPQPDGVLLIDELSGGQATISADDYLEGPPELVVEVAASSAAHDLREKHAVYHRNGVREYIVWAVYEREVHWFNLSTGAEARLAPDEAGIMRSQVFPGLWLDAPALLQDDLAGVLRCLQQGLASTEHQEFVVRLAAAKHAAQE